LLKFPSTLSKSVGFSLGESTTLIFWNEGVYKWGAIKLLVFLYIVLDFFYSIAYWYLLVEILGESALEETLIGDFYSVF
jgi:hypothetical protein